MKLIKYSSYIFFSLVIILLLTVPIRAVSFDERVREVVLKSDQGLVDETMSLVTHLGNGAVDYAIACALPDEEARRDARRSILVAGVSAVVLKCIIGQKRPPGPVEYKHFTIDSDYHAMPSGHTSTAFALATSVSTHYPEYKKVAYTLATLVGISRLYEDAHWASNVIAGAGVGYLSARFVEWKF